MMFLPKAVKVVLAISIGVIVFAGYRAAASASFFQIRNVDVTGVSKTSADDIKMIVRREGNSNGVWRADLNQMSTEIGKLTWVKNAVVSRVLPDGVRVRITERTPRAVVHISSGRFFWVDEDAVLLGEVQPGDQMPDFFLRGWGETLSNDDRAANRVRIEKFLAMVKDFSAAGYSARISEVDLNDVLDVRVQLAGDDSSVAIWLGGQDFAKRLSSGLKTLDARKDMPQGAFITHIDVSQGTRAVVGFDRPVKNTPLPGETASDAAPDQQPKPSASSQTGTSKDKASKPAAAGRSEKKTDSTKARKVV
jgi:hypothetical protein